MSMLPKINVILEEEIIMYEDDQRLLREDGEYSLNEYAIKVDDYLYNYYLLPARPPSLKHAKIAVMNTVLYGHFGNFRTSISPDEEKFICAYCGGDAIGEAEVFLRKITIYKRPPKGAKDMKINAGNSPYIYRLGTRAAYCKKCGSTE